jgi:hypothetical protein
VLAEDLAEVELAMWSMTSGVIVRRRQRSRLTVAKARVRSLISTHGREPGRTRHHAIG